MNRLLIATNNKGKLQEIRALLRGLHAELVIPADLAMEMQVAENGRTYTENATLKAVAFARASKLIALADDSGLEVEALGGEPGLFSARYLPVPGATDADRRVFLLQKLSSQPRPWTARFRAAVAIAEPNGEVNSTEGECPGEVIAEERGAGGFGYDPIFLVAETGRTMAQLSMDEKNMLSHRAQAITKARGILEGLFGPWH